jgi:hypothetical protein
MLVFKIDVCEILMLKKFVLLERERKPYLFSPPDTTSEEI